MSQTKSKSLYLRPYAYLKRLFDLLFALVLAVPAVLAVLICCIAIKLESKGPAFFKQRRPGYKGKVFTIYKLRTMIVETERDGVPLGDMERMTKSGAIIRKLSLDELPQLLNVLLGQMSFIGPRPLLVEYLDKYSPEQMRRHDVLPGISGWAQVNGRNELSWDEKFALDVYYVDHMSLWLDLKVLFKTIANVFTSRGINASEGNTMEKFEG